MSTKKIRSKEEDTKNRSKMTPRDVPSECLDDPQFIKVLAASLCSEIAALELILNETDAQIKGLKENVTKGLEKRKVFKEFTHEFTKKRMVLSTAFEGVNSICSKSLPVVQTVRPIIKFCLEVCRSILASSYRKLCGRRTKPCLEREGKNRSIEVETVKNRLDDATLREIADRAQYKKILDNYQETWKKYKAAYEERPLAKKRQQACITLKQLRGRLMMAEYEKHNFITMLKERKKIDNIRVRVSIVEISGLILQRWKDQSYIYHLNTVATQLQDKLNTYTHQLLQLEQEEERKKRAKIEISMMPPPRLDFSFMRSIYNEHKNVLKRSYPRITLTRDSDAASINTLMLEEMCKTTANDEDTEVCKRKKNPVADEDEEVSLNITSVSIVQEQPGPIKTIANQNDKLPVSDSMVNQSDVQNELKKLCIEKKTTSANNYYYGSPENESNDNEIRVEESHQRTRRWCEESQQKFACFLLTGPNSINLNEQMKGGLSDERYKSVERKFVKASSIHESETRSLHHAENEKKFKNGTLMDIPDEPSEATDLQNSNCHGMRIDQKEIQDQKKRLSEENTRIEVGAPQSREWKLQDQIPSFTITTPTNNQQSYEIPQLYMPTVDYIIATQESKTSNDHSELRINTGCSKPKIMKVEAVNYSLGQRPNNTVVMSDSHRPDISNSVRQYVPSCMSSNLSNTFEVTLQEMPQDSCCGENKAIAGFPSLSNWKNWSPPNSERSFTSSISKIGKNKETPVSEPHNPPKEQNQLSQFDFGGFFSIKPSQNTRNIF